jgi:hypothetical protein
MFMSMVASYVPFDEEHGCKIIGHPLPLREGSTISDGEEQPPSRRNHDHARQRNIGGSHSDNLIHCKLLLCLNKRPPSKGSWCCLDKRPAFLWLSPSLLLLVDFHKRQINRMPTIEAPPHFNFQKLAFNIINAIPDH